MKHSKAGAVHGSEAGPLRWGWGLFFPPRNMPPRDSPTHRQTRGHMLTASLFFPDLKEQHWKISRYYLNPKTQQLPTPPEGHCNQSALPFQRQKGLPQTSWASCVLPLRSYVQLIHTPQVASNPLLLLSDKGGLPEHGQLPWVEHPC